MRKKAQQKAIMSAQAELRPTRTRRQVKRPDYVYNDATESDDDPDESFIPGNEGQHEDDEGFRSDTASSSKQAPLEGRRRSARTATATATVSAANGKNSDIIWRGERRSRRLGVDPQLDEPPLKRARTADTVSSDADGIEIESIPDSSSTSTASHNKSKASGAAAIKAGETAVEQVAGRKRSRFWYYAVEPARAPGVLPEHDRSNFRENGSVWAMDRRGEANGERMDVDDSPFGREGGPPSPPAIHS